MRRVGRCCCRRDRVGMLCACMCCASAGLTFTWPTRMAPPRGYGMVSNPMACGPSAWDVLVHGLRETSVSEELREPDCLGRLTHVSTLKPHSPPMKM